MAAVKKFVTLTVCNIRKGPTSKIESTFVPGAATSATFSITYVIASIPALVSGGSLALNNN
jgi:hypothetical protein